MELHAGTQSVTPGLRYGLNDALLLRIYSRVPQFRIIYSGVIHIRGTAADPANFPWNHFGK
jgi:hypothetical protein